MNPKTYLHVIAAKALSILGAVLAHCNMFALAITYYNIAITVDPKCLRAYLQTADTFVKMGKYLEAATIYKKAIGLQPTLSTVYNLGFKLAREGSLNNEFYQSILNVVATPEIVSMIKYLAKSPTIYQPSKLWLYFMIFNTFQLETGGIVNFKRTVNHNYFNWTADLDVNKQFQSLKNELNWSDSDIVNAEISVYFDSTVKPKEFTERKWRKYIEFLCMLWEFTSKKDRLMLLNQLQEPELGNPIVIEYKGHKVAQDICNSVMEVNTIMEFTKHNPQERMKVIELGAGHGRVANVLLHALANVQVVIVDIPPALYVSQWYLSNLFSKHRVFKFRDFSNYREVKHEFEESSIAFLSPAQVEYLPDQMFDLFINISSLHEMTYAQIEMWFGHIDRVCNKWFYTKQYIESKNAFDNIVIRQKDYPVRAHWQELLNRRSPIYPELFEAIYRVH